MIGFFRPPGLRQYRAQRIREIRRLAGASRQRSQEPRISAAGPADVTGQPGGSFFRQLFDQRDAAFDSWKRFDLCTQLPGGGPEAGLLEQSV